MDLSAYSNEELLAMYGKKKPLSEMSDDELLSMYNQRNRQPSIVDEIGAPTQQPDVTGVSPMAQRGESVVARNNAAQAAGVLGQPEPVSGGFVQPNFPMNNPIMRNIVRALPGLIPTIQLAQFFDSPEEFAKGAAKFVPEQAGRAYRALGKPGVHGIPSDIGGAKEAWSEIGQDPLGIPMAALTVAGLAKGVAGLRGVKPSIAPKIAPAEVAPEPILRGKTVLEEMAPEKPVEVAKTTPAADVVDVNKFRNVNIEHIPADLQVEVEAIGARSGKITKIKDTAANAIKEVENRISQYKALWECLKA